MLHAQIFFSDLVCPQTHALAAAFPALQLFTHVYLYRNRRLLELSQPIITQILHVLFLQAILKNLPQYISPVLQAPDQDFIINCTQVHLSPTVHLLRFMLGKEYHLVDVVTLVNKSPWSMYLFKFHLLLLLSNYADNSCAGNPEGFGAFRVNGCISLKSRTFKVTTSGSVRTFILF